MTKSKMYQERKANIPAYRGCAFNCVYCAFKHTMSRSKCQQCRAFEPHAHIEVLNKRPPLTKEGEFLTMGLNGDIAFASEVELVRMLLYCNAWDDRTFVLQTKDPRMFVKFTDFIKPNMILGTTIETNRHTSFISKAPYPLTRYLTLKNVDCKKMVTIEPIMQFDEMLFDWIVDLGPEIVYIGYDSKNNHLPEPTLAETLHLIKQMKDAGLDVRTKLLRKAWDEQ